MAALDDVVDQLLEVFDGDRDELKAEIIAAELDLAERAADYARSISPEETGEYRDAINVHQDDSAVWVGFDSEHAYLVEYGSVNSPEFAVRARTEEHLNQND